MPLSKREEITARLLAGLLANPQALAPPVFIYKSDDDSLFNGRVLPGQIVAVDEPNDFRQIEANLAALAVRYTDALMIELGRTTAPREYVRCLVFEAQSDGYRWIESDQRSQVFPTADLAAEALAHYDIKWEAIPESEASK